MQWSFPPQPETPGEARRQLEPVLEAWGLLPDDRWSVLLVMNELVTNAVEHAGTALRLTVSATDEGVLVEVWDQSVAEPRRRSPDTVSQRSHGLRVVEGLACWWDWSSSAAGKTVRAMVAPEGS